MLQKRRNHNPMSPLKKVVSSCKEEGEQEERYKISKRGVSSKKNTPARTSVVFKGNVQRTGLTNSKNLASARKTASGGKTRAKNAEESIHEKVTLTWKGNKPRKGEMSIQREEGTRTRSALETRKHPPWFGRSCGDGCLDGRAALVEGVGGEGKPLKFPFSGGFLPEGKRLETAGGKEQKEVHYQRTPRGGGRLYFLGECKAAWEGKKAGASKKKSSSEEVIP